MAGRKKPLDSDEFNALVEARLKDAYPDHDWSDFDLAGLAAEIGLDPDLPAQTRFQNAMELMPYVRPKLKSVEHTGDQSGPAIYVVQVSERDGDNMEKAIEAGQVVRLDPSARQRQEALPDKGSGGG